MSIDDFGVHLDEERQRFFIDKLSSLHQIFLTSPTEERELFPGKQMIVIDSGKVVEVSSA